MVLSELIPDSPLFGNVRFCLLISQLLSDWLKGDAPYAEGLSNRDLGSQELPLVISILADDDSLIRKLLCVVQILQMSHWLMSVCLHSTSLTNLSKLGPLGSLLLNRWPQVPFHRRKSHLVQMTKTFSMLSGKKLKPWRCLQRDSIEEKGFQGKGKEIWSAIRLETDCMDS